MCFDQVFISQQVRSVYHNINGHEVKDFCKTLGPHVNLNSTRVMTFFLTFCPITSISMLETESVEIYHAFVESLFHLDSISKCISSVKSHCCQMGTFPLFFKISKVDRLMEIYSVSRNVQYKDVNRTKIEI